MSLQFVSLGLCVLVVDLLQFESADTVCKPGENESLDFATGSEAASVQ